MARTAALLPLALLVACSTAPAPDGSGSSGGATRGHSDDTDAIRADLAEARRQLAIEEMSAAHELLVANAEFESAGRALQKASDELDLWKLEGFELEDAQLGIQRAEFRLEATRAELAELEAMYAEEEFAKTTKELVLTRGRREVEMAEASLEIARHRYQHKVREVEMERTSKEAAITEARTGVAKAEHELRKAELQSELDVLRARRKVEELEKKLAKQEFDS